MADSQLSTTEETAHAAAVAAAPAPAASSSLLDGFEEEEEQGDTQTLLAKTAAGTSQISMDFDEEEDDDNEANKLLKKQEKASRKLVQEDDNAEEDDNDEGKKDKKKQKKEKKKDKKEKKEKKRNKHRKEEEASEADEEDAEEEEGEAGFYDMMEDEVAMGEEERRLNNDYGEDDDDEDDGDAVDVITSLSLPALNADQQVPATTQCYAMHLPSFLSIATPQFDSSKLSSTEQEFVVRWRRQGDKMESNTSIVEYTDGTLDLFVGDTCVANLKLSTTSNEYVFVRNTSLDDDGNHLCLSKLHTLSGNAMLIASDQLNVSQVMSRHTKQKAKIVEKLTELDPELEQDLRSKRVDQAHRSTVKSRNRQSHLSASKKKDEFTSGFLEQGNKKRQKRARSSDEEEEEDEAFKSSSPDDASSSDNDDD